MIAAALPKASRRKTSPSSIPTPFFRDEARLNILPAHEFPRATDNVRRRWSTSRKTLVDKGFAYVVEGNVYFEVGEVPGLRKTVAPASRRSRGRRARRRRPPETRSARLCALEGRRARPAPEVAEPLGRRIPRLAYRMLGDGQPATSAPRSTSTPAASITSSPITKTRSPRARRHSVVSTCGRGFTASTCSSMASRWRSPPATLT